MRDKISACVITFNEEAHIKRCLESLTWCDEIVVIDSFSTDNTVALCRQYTDRIEQHPWQGYIGQRNLIREMASHPWVLFLDADEEMPIALREEIIAALREDKGRYNGYRFPRRVYYLDQWILHGEWYPDMKLRLFKKDKGRSAGEEPHDQVCVQGPVRTLRSPLWHYTYEDIKDHLRTINRFSTISAQSKYNKGYRFRWIDFIFRPSFRFLKGYIIKAGFLDGRRGLFIALFSSFAVALKYAKVWELQCQEKKDNVS
jgi:glycosyltransferase involved in cell wall biosynthesis